LLHQFLLYCVSIARSNSVSGTSLNKKNLTGRGKKLCHSEIGQLYFSLIKRYLKKGVVGLSDLITLVQEMPQKFSVDASARFNAA